MVSVETLIAEEKASRIPEIEISRYVTFFQSSYQDNLEHAMYVEEAFPRWSIISGYYAMHDMTKLLIAELYGLRIDFEVHATTIKILSAILKDKEVIHLLEEGYQEFITLANDLAQAKRERVKTQYYTGTTYSHQRFQKRAESFRKQIVIPYIEKMKALLTKNDNTTL